MRREDERRKLMLPHFETIGEREQRLKQEREAEEFGPISLEFRLSTPDPRYIATT